jgi:hypothetical protein
MKISLVLEDIGAGPQVIFSTGSPDEARKFYKAHNAAGRVYLVCNPTPEGVKLNKAQTPVETSEAPKPASRRRAEAAPLI